MRLLVLLFIFFSHTLVANQVTSLSAGQFEITNTEIYTIDSKVLERSYDIYVKLPYDYHDEKSNNKTYPVLYLNDGPHTFKVAAGITHFRSMDRAIVVGLSFAQGENGQSSRVRDLTPEIDKTWVKYQTGGAPDYLRFIEHELFAFIENRYRANPAKRILSGHSLGGSFGAWVLLTKPELFSSYILTSPSFWYKGEMILDVEAEYAKKHNMLNRRVFIATGGLETLENGLRNDMVQGHKNFVNRLKLRNYKGLEIRDEVVAGTDHFTTFPVGLAKGLRWIYQDI